MCSNDAKCCNDVKLQEKCQGHQLHNKTVKLTEEDWRLSEQATLFLFN